MSDFNVGTPNVIDARVKGVSRDEHSGIAFANFKAHKFSYLNITSLATVYVLNGRECGLACVNIPSCFSFNLAAFYDVTGKILCELLPSDKYNNSDKFVTRKLFHHFSIRVSMNSPTFIIIHRALVKEKNCLCPCIRARAHEQQQEKKRHHQAFAHFLKHLQSIYNLHDTFIQRIYLVIQ